MSVKERLARANWELNCLFRTGRIPKCRTPTPCYTQGTSFGRNQLVCRACGRQLTYGSGFCDHCGTRFI